MEKIKDVLILVAVILFLILVMRIAEIEEVRFEHQYQK